MPDLEGNQKGEETKTPLHAHSEGREDDLKHDPAMDGVDESDSPPYQQPEEGKGNEPAKH